MPHKSKNLAQRISKMFKKEKPVKNDSGNNLKLDDGLKPVLRR